MANQAQTVGSLGGKGGHANLSQNVVCPSSNSSLNFSNGIHEGVSVAELDSVQCLQKAVQVGKKECKSLEVKTCL